jgi:hypothetical protein
MEDIGDALLEDSDHTDPDFVYEFPELDGIVERDKLRAQAFLFVQPIVPVC